MPNDELNRAPSVPEPRQDLPKEGRRMSTPKCRECGNDLPIPDAVTFYYMHDNHTFTLLTGSTVPEIAEDASRIAKESPCGMLCGATLKHGDKEQRRIVANVHDGGRTRPDQFQRDLPAWIAAHEADADVMRILSAASPPIQQDGAIELTPEIREAAETFARVFHAHREHALDPVFDSSALDEGTPDEKLRALGAAFRKGGK